MNLALSLIFKVRTTDNHLEALTKELSESLFCRICCISLRICYYTCKSDVKKYLHFIISSYEKKIKVKQHTRKELHISRKGSLLHLPPASMRLEVHSH